MRTPFSQLFPAATATALGLVLALPQGAIAAPRGHHDKGHHMGRDHACHMQMRRPARISVTGAGESTIAPDMAMINLGVTTQAASAAEAMDANTAQQTQVIDALAAQGIEARDIQTSGLNLSPLMEYPEGQAPRVTGYQAQNIVTVRVRDLTSLGATLDTLVGAGANEMNGISFLREDPGSAQDEARTEAVEAARHSAEVLANASGMVLGPILSIRDTPQMGGGPRPMMMAREAADASAVPIQAGELTVNASVEVAWALTSAECVKAMGPGGEPGEGPGPDGKEMLPPGHPPVPGLEVAPGDAAPMPEPGAEPGAEPMPAPGAEPAPSPAPSSGGEAAPAPETAPDAMPDPATEAPASGDAAPATPPAPGGPAADVPADPGEIGAEDSAGEPMPAEPADPAPASDAAPEQAPGAPAADVPADPADIGTEPTDTPEDDADGGSDATTPPSN